MQAFRYHRISPEAIERARGCGYNEETLKLCEETQNSIEIIPAVIHRGVYEFLKKQNQGIYDDGNFDLNSGIIHAYKESQTFSEF